MAIPQRGPRGRSRPVPARPEGPRAVGLDELALATALSLGLVALWRLIVPLARTACCDALQYLAMAGDPARTVPAPYSHRVLAPRLVHLLGGDPATRFHLLSLVCLAATGPLVHVLARQLGASPASALVATAGLLCSRGWAFYLADPWLSDPAALLLVAAAFVALGAGRLRALAAILVPLAGTREIFVGLALPVWAWLRQRLGGLTAAAAVALVMLPGCLVWMWIVATVPSTGLSGLDRLSAPVVAEVWRTRVAADGWRWVANAFAMSLGCWWVLAAASWRDPRVRPLGWWLVAVFGQCLLGGDWSRFALYAFCVVIPAAAVTLERAARRGPLLALLAAQAAVPVLDVLAGRPALNYPGPSLVVTLMLMVATAAVLLVPDAGRRRPRGGSRVAAQAEADEFLDRLAAQLEEQED